MRFWPKSAPADDPAPAPPITTLTRRAPDWPSVPGIQRVVTSMTPIADRAGFEHSLRTHQDPTFLAPLAHLVDPDGPSGRISGLMTPAPTPIQGQSASVAKAGVVQRWPPRWLGGPVISRAADPSPAPAEAPAEAIETPQVEDTAPDESHAEVQRTSAPIDPIPVQRALAPTDPVAPQRTSAAADPPTAPLATSPIDPRTAQHATAPVDPIAVQRVSVPTDSVEVPEVRTAPLLSDPHHLQPPTAPATAPTPIAPAVPVQRSLVRAPEPEPLFRTLPVVARSADADATRDAPAESPAFSIPETEPETAREVGALALPPRSPTESAPPTTTERSTADMPVPTVRDPEPARATSTPTIGVQRRASADGSTPGNTAPPAPTQESRLPLDTQPRKLGLGAPLERPPEPAAQVEVISLQQWAAARDAAPQVSQSSPQITAAEPVSERGPQMDTAPTAHPVATDPDPLTSEAGGLDSVPTLGADEPVAEHAVQRTPDRDIATYEAPPASANPPMQPTAESVALLGERPSLLETIAGSTPPSAADPTAPSATTPAFATPAAAGLTPTTTATAAVQRHRESSIPVHKDAVDSLVPRAIMKPGSPSVQRSVPAPPTPAPAPAPALAPAPAPAPAQRLVDDPAARPMSLLSIARAEHPVGRPESAAPAHRAATVQRSVQSATVAQVPRSAPAAAPAADPPGRRGADAGSIAVAAGIAHRESDGSVVFAMPDTAPRAASVQRAVEVGEMTVDNPAPASAPAGADASAPAASAPAASASAASASASASPAGGGPAAAAGATPNLDELARRLYDPLAARIKAELRLDRERFGLVTDLRRP